MEIMRIGEKPVSFNTLEEAIEFIEIVYFIETHMIIHFSK